MPYDIARPYEVREGSAKYRVASDIGAKLRPVLDWVATRPAGVYPDSLSFDPGHFDFDKREHVVETADDVP